MRRIWEPEGKEKNMEEKEKPNYRGLPLILIAAYCKVLIFNYVPSVLRENGKTSPTLKSIIEKIIAQKR
jgi:hypothetical protein